MATLGVIGACESQPYRKEHVMTKNVLALGLDPNFVDPKEFAGVSVQLVEAFITKEIERLRELGFEVDSCLVDLGDTAEVATMAHLESRTYDCVVIGAGLRSPAQLLLFEKLLNLVHTLAPQAKIYFNSSPADTAEAVQRCVQAK